MFVYAYIFEKSFQKFMNTLCKCVRGIFFSLEKREKNKKQQQQQKKNHLVFIL